MWWRIEYVAEPPSGTSTLLPGSVLSGLAKTLRTPNQTIGAEVRNPVVQPSTFCLTVAFEVEAESLGAAWLQGLVILNRAAAVASMPPWSLTSCTVQLS